MLKEYILAIDQGTTGTTCALIDVKKFNIVEKINIEFPQIYPNAGWVEHNLEDIWSTVAKGIKTILKRKQVKKGEIASIGITNQRETLCAFNKKGEPCGNAIVWQDRRTSKFCEDLKGQAGVEARVRELTGLPIDPYFTATKINWLQNNKKIKNVRFGNIDTYLLYKLSDGKSYFTDATNASRTLLMNLQTGAWDDGLLNLFQVQKESLPEILDSFTLFGKTKNLSFLPDGIPITGILGDQQSALLGQGGYRPGHTKCTYGTGAFILQNIGHELLYSLRGLLTTVAYKHQGQMSYALEGSCYIAGAAITWLRDNLKFFSKSKDIEKIASNVKDLKDLVNLYFFPYFTGIGSPYWNSNVKGVIWGLTRDTSRENISRACLEGIAFSVNDLISAFELDTKAKISSMRVDGGAVQSDLLMQIQSNVSELELLRPKNIETTVFGAALASALGNNMINFDQIDRLWKKEKSFVPDKDREKNQQEYYTLKKENWSRLVNLLIQGFGK